MDKFTYLGSTLSQAVHIDNNINIRIIKVSAAFGWLCNSVWERTAIKLETKLKVYQVIVILPTLLYGCKAWTVLCHARKFNHLHLSCLRKLLGIEWQDRISAWHLKSSIGPIFPAFPPCLWKHSSGGLVMWLDCPAQDCQNKSSLGSLKNGKQVQGGPKKG